MLRFNTPWSVDFAHCASHKWFRWDKEEKWCVIRDCNLEGPSLEDWIHLEFDGKVQRNQQKEMPGWYPIHSKMGKSQVMKGAFEIFPPSPERGSHHNIMTFSLPFSRPNREVRSLSVLMTRSALIRDIHFCSKRTRKRHQSLHINEARNGGEYRRPDGRSVVWTNRVGWTLV